MCCCARSRRRSGEQQMKKNNHHSLSMFFFFLSVTLAFWHGIFSSSNTQFQTLTMVWVMMIIMIFLTVVFSYFSVCVYKKYVLSIQRELIEECKIDKKNADHINFGGAKKHDEIDKAFSFFSTTTMLS